MNDYWNFEQLHVSVSSDRMGQWHVQNFSDATSKEWIRLLTETTASVKTTPVRFKSGRKRKSLLSQDIHRIHNLSPLVKLFGI